MGTALRHRLIGFGFKAWVWSVRARRLLGALGRPRLRGVEHFTIPVKDLAVARHFYCDVLGGALMMTIDDAALKKFGRPPAPNGGSGTADLPRNGAASCRRGGGSVSRAPPTSAALDFPSTGTRCRSRECS